jgi:hypothetical protein
MTQFNAPRPQAKEETPEEKAAWLAMREHVNDLALVEEQKFDLPGRITSITGADDGGFLWKKIKDRTSGALVDTPHLKVAAKLDDPKYAALRFVKDMKVSFFDGVLRGQSQKSPFRGQFYYIHRAAKGIEPSPGIVNGTEPFDTDEYVNVPMRVVLLYQGRVGVGEDYYGQRANMKIWLDHFEPTPETVKRTRRADDDGYGESPAPVPFIPDAPQAEAPSPKPKGRPKKQESPAPVSPPASPASDPVTERQVRFIFAIGDEAGMSVGEVSQFALELCGQAIIQDLTRAQASQLIGALQMERNSSPDTADQLGLPV